MLQHRVRHFLSLMKNHELVGIVSDRNIRDASPSILIDAAEQKHLLKSQLEPS